MAKKTDRDKAAKHESKGDKLLEKGKLDKALAQYRKALEMDPDLPGIFDKLIKVRDELGDEWKLKDFAESVCWTMEKQAQEYPPIRQVHAMLSPEWKMAMELALSILGSPRDEPKGEDVEDLVGMGDVATRVLLAILFDLKRTSKTKPDEVTDE
ncbi:MAG: tetratricopeptide repeat protein [Pseudomonadota bacterium]